MTSGDDPPRHQEVWTIALSPMQSPAVRRVGTNAIVRGYGVLDDGQIDRPECRSTLAFGCPQERARGRRQSSRHRELLAIKRLKDEVRHGVKCRIERGLEGHRLRRFVNTQGACPFRGVIPSEH